MKRLVLVACILTLPLLADQIVLKNGDRLTGAVVKSDKKQLVFQADLAGTVTVPWDAVTSITSTTPLHVGLADGQVVVGTVSTLDGRVTIQTKDTGVVTAARDNVEFIRSEKEEAAYEAQIERYEHPRIVDLWAGTLDLGYSQTTGNAVTSNLSVNANANRATTRDKIGVTFTSLYARSNATGASIVTANAIRGGLDYNLNLNARSFAFASLDMEFDKFQDLDLRFAPAGGFGYQVVKQKNTDLALKGGVSLDREFFSTGLNRTSGEALIGQDLTYMFNKTTSLQESFVLFPNVTDTGTYRMNFDTSLATSIRKWLGWQFTLSDRFLSDPVAGRKKNDLLLSTGVRLTLAK